MWSSMFPLCHCAFYHGHIRCSANATVLKSKVCCVCCVFAAFLCVRCLLKGQAHENKHSTTEPYCQQKLETLKMPFVFMGCLLDDLYSIALSAQKRFSSDNHYNRTPPVVPSYVTTLPSSLYDFLLRYVNTNLYTHRKSTESWI